MCQENGHFREMFIACLTGHLKSSLPRGQHERNMGLNTCPWSTPQESSSSKREIQPQVYPFEMIRANLNVTNESHSAELKQPRQPSRDQNKRCGCYSEMSDCNSQKYCATASSSKEANDSSAAELIRRMAIGSPKLMFCAPENEFLWTRRCERSSYYVPKC